MAADDRLTAHERHESGQGPQEGGLARAVGPGEEHDLARGGVEVDTGEGGEAIEQADGAAKVDDRSHGDRSNGTGARESRPRRVVRGIGRLLIAVGTLLLLFVAYQLWGTGLHEARSQRDLRHDFEAELSTTTTSEAPGSTDTAPA